jgi:glucokinase
MSEADILVADIGGTNARFALASRSGDGFHLRARQRFSAQAFTQFSNALAAYIAGLDARPMRACFAVAGPIIDDEVDVTNSPWLLRRDALAAHFGFRAVRLVNDFAAQARGAPLLGASDLAVIAPGRAVAGAPIVVLGPGTGLGLSVLVPTPAGPQVLPTEGGHTAFAPQSDLERRVQAELQQRNGYVSYEGVCSGVGLAATYQALGAIAGATLAPLDAAALASRCDTDDHARAAFEIFFSALGVFAGNAVLSCGGRGGLYLAGGILPKNRDALAASAFLQRLRARGPMSPYLAELPIWLILSEETALLGAAALADDLSRGEH